MKNLFFYFLLFCFLQVGYSQEDVTILRSSSEISFLLNFKNDFYEENFTLQFESNTGNKTDIKIEKYHNFKYLFDGYSLITFLDNKISIYTISSDLKGDNVIKGVGLSKRVGKFKILKDIKNKSDIFTLVISDNISKMNQKGTYLTCHSGGPGSSECSTESGSPIAGGSCSVKCSDTDKYFACCDDVKNECRCVRFNPSDYKGVNDGIFEHKVTILYDNDTLELKIHDEINNKGYKIYLYNIYGNKIAASSKTNEIINTSHLDDGYYFCIIEKDGVFVKSEKIFIHRE